MITPQGDETAVQPPAGAASSVKSFLWDLTGVGGVRLDSPTAAVRDGGRRSDSPPFVGLAVSPRRFPGALCFTGFSISHNARTPTIFGRKLVNLFLGASWLKGNLTRTYRRRGTAPGLFFIRRGEESHSSSFWDCHNGSAWQTVAHHLLEKNNNLCQMKCTVEVVGETRALTCCSSIRGPDLAKNCMRKTDKNMITCAN